MFINANMKFYACLLLFLSFLFGQDITYKSLLEEMVDRNANTTWPAHSYISKQASSYDRRSISPDQDGWFANYDFSNFIRCDTIDGRKEWVMMDEKGPGSIVRIWMTGSMDYGKIRVYLDSSETPVIESVPSSLIGGNLLVGPPLSAVRSKGSNLYLPIPFNKSCKITYDGKKSGFYFYYQVGYRLYEPGTEIETFSTTLLDSLSDVVEEIQTRLLNPEDEEETPDHSLTGLINPGESIETNISGPMAIEKLEFKLDAIDFKQALRSTVLSISFDGKETVWCPLGDFFGSGRGFNPYKSWWMEVGDDSTLSCYWEMPFENNCTVKLINHGNQSVDISVGSIETKDYEWTDNSLYFHGTWHMNTNVPTKAQIGEDYNFITINGKGIFVGDVLTIHNNGGSWWGEGDEKISVDSDTFPSFFGTGTEDYYGYAWCWHEFFEAPFHAQPTGRGNPGSGFSTNLRTRSLDGIPFEEYFNFDMETWHWGDANMQYINTLLWYGNYDAIDNYDHDLENVKRSVYKTSSGFIECEILDVCKYSGGILEYQYLPQFNWSENTQVWWRDASIGDSLVIEFPADTSMYYDIRMNMTKANDYAIASFYVNGELLLDSYDFYNSSVVNTGEMSIGKKYLDAGMHKLTVKINGCNSKAIKRYMIGLDYINLLPATTNIEDSEVQINEFKLNQNYPNPFNPSTKIQYSLPKHGNVKIDIYNINGELIENLINDKQQAGKYELIFNGANYSSGIYLCQLTSNNYNSTIKMLLVK